MPSTTRRPQSTARNFNEDDVDDALAHARAVRDLMTGAAALLAAQESPGALEEIVSVASRRADSLIAALEQGRRVANEKLRR